MSHLCQRETRGEVSTYILRKIDDDLWKRVKAKAALQGVSIRALIERLLQEWAQ